MRKYCMRSCLVTFGRVGLRAAGLLAILSIVACGSRPEKTQTVSDSTATPEPVAVATAVPVGENVALEGVVRASAWSGNASLAIDGDVETMWSAQELAHQWFR